MRPVHEQLEGASPDAPKTIEVRQRRDVIRPGSVYWLTPEDSPVHCVGCRNAYNNGWSNGNAWTREDALRVMEAECNERYVLSEMWMHSEGAGVWTTPEGAVLAAQREYVERTALADFWRAAKPVHRVPDEQISPIYAAKFSAAMGGHRAWHALRLPTPYPMAAALVVTYRKADTTGIVLGSAGAATMDKAVSKAMVGTAMIYFGSKRPGNRRRVQFMRWASRHTAGFLWPLPGDTPPEVQKTEPLPKPSIFSRNGPYHFAMCPVPDEGRMMLLDGYHDALG